MLNRRQVIQLSLSTATGASVTANSSAMDSAKTLGSAKTQDTAETAEQIVDTNAHLFQWPLRRLPLDSTKRLVSKYRSLGVSQAWVSSFDGLLHRDITSVNDRLAARCATFDELLPIGAINLSLPDWEGDLKRCFVQHQMRGVRLYPSYHQYTLDDPRMVELLHRATEAGCFVQVVVALEDLRTQHTLLRVKDVDLTPLAETMSQVKGVVVQLLNARIAAERLTELAKIDGLHFDTARVDSTDGVPRFVEQLPAGRVMLGTHAPLLIPAAALIRTHESGQLDQETLRSVFSGNAKRLLAGAVS